MYFKKVYFKIAKHQIVDYHFPHGVENMIHSNQVAMRKIVSTCMCLVFLIGMVAYFPQISEGKEAGSILPPPDGGGNVLAGEGGGGDPPFPPGFTPVKHPEPSLLNETSDENNSWPDVGDQWVSNGTRPLSDLVPMNSSGYPNPVEGGENTTLKSRIKNIGYAFLSSTELAFYDGVVSNGTLIGKREVNLYSGEGEADILWSVSAFGNHTVIVVADPDDDEEELNETNNMISFNLEVIYGPLPGPIDLSITTEAVESGDLIQVNSSASVNITVTNIDSGIATNIDVRVIERPLNSTVANYTIDSLEAYSSHTQTINWTPQVNATNYLEVILDENNSLNDSLNERNESNNVASAGFFVLPWIEEWDPPGPQDCGNGVVLFPGDLVVPNGTTRILYNCLIVVRGNVLVSGTLILIDSVLIMFALTPNDFVVFQGGTLSANVGTITSLAQSVGFNFHLSYGSTIALSELTVQWVTGEKDYDSPSGIRVYTDSLTFQDVAIRESMYHGLYVNESAGGAIISGLTIPNSGYSGIFLSSNSSAIVRNNVLDENLDGIYLSNTNSDSEVQGNDITNNMRFGILASSAATEIHNNTIEFNGLGFWYYYGSGIDIHSSSSLIHNNTILHNRNGIVVKGNTSNVVQDNNISENFFAGLYFLDIVSDGFPIVENNTGISFNLYGIIDVRTSAFIENNTLEENYVAVYTRTSTSNYTLNSFVGNKFSVLSFGWSSISVYDNSFSRGSISYAIYGIYSMASFLQIIENDFEDLEISVWERGS
ncbi:MAG: right-handed parallel beta-helix repeat-containing protein, partial [Thermoplasmata archaeon]